MKIFKFEIPYLFTDLNGRRHRAFAEYYFNRLPSKARLLLHLKDAEQKRSVSLAQKWFDNEEFINLKLISACIEINHPNLGLQYIYCFEIDVENLS